MPQAVGMALPRVSQLVVDADLTIPAAYKVITNNVQSNAGAALNLIGGAGLIGLHVSAVTGNIFSNYALAVGTIFERTTGARVAFPNGIKTDTIDDNGAATISVLEDIVMDTGKYLESPTLCGDVITDKAGTGAPGFSLGIKTDDINEYTGAHGIDLNDPVTLAALQTALTQMYRTAGASDNMQKTDATEVSIAEPPVGHTFLKGSITVPDVYVGSANKMRVKVTAKKTNAGGVVAIRAYINAVDQGAWNNLTNAYVEYSLDLSGIRAGDIITVYCYSSVAGGGNVYAKNLKLCCDDTIAQVLGSYTWP